MKLANVHMASNLQKESIYDQHSYPLTPFPANLRTFHSWQLRYDLSRSYEGGL